MPELRLGCAVAEVATTQMEVDERSPGVFNWLEILFCCVLPNLLSCTTSVLWNVLVEIKIKKSGFDNFNFLKVYLFKILIITALKCFKNLKLVKLHYIG